MQTPTAKKLAGLVRACPICKGPLTGHSYRLIGSVLCGRPENAETIASFLTLLSQRNWPQFRTHKEFDGLRDVLIAYAIACPSRAGFVISMRDNSELFEPDELLRCDTLEAIEWEQLQEEFRHEQWESF